MMLIFFGVHIQMLKVMQPQGSPKDILRVMVAFVFLDPCRQADVRKGVSGTMFTVMRTAFGGPAGSVTVTRV